MKFENTKVSGFENAIRGMRNPKNSWEKSDSYFDIVTEDWLCDNEDIDLLIEAWMKIRYPEVDLAEMPYNEFCDKNDATWQWLDSNMHLDYSKGREFTTIAAIGPNDMKLMRQLIKAGSEHRKFMRQIFVSVDITAPLYWWKEMDQYKVATTTNSTSTMHKLASTPITLDCFEIDDYQSIISNIKIDGEICLHNDEHEVCWGNSLDSNVFEQIVVPYCELLRQKYLETKDIRYWRELIRILPESWLQKRTWTCNYETLLGICSIGQRRRHKLVEWSQNFISWARSLPYAQELLFLDEVDSIH